VTAFITVVKDGESMDIYIGYKH